MEEEIGQNQSNIRSRKDRSKRDIKKFIEEKIPEDNVCYIACNLLEMFWNIEGRSKGHNNEHLASAIIYIAYRKAFVPKNMEEVVKLCDIRKKILYRNYKFVRGILGMKYCEAPSQISSNCILPQESGMFIGRFGRELNLSEKTIKDALILDERFRNVFFSKNPSALAGAYLSISANKNNEYKLQREISMTTNISEMTLRKSLREINNKIAEEEKKVKEMMEEER